MRLKRWYDILLFTAAKRVVAGVDGDFLLLGSNNYQLHKGPRRLAIALE
jgi:hypothetical protein